jgi:hypothetical protein
MIANTKLAAKCGLFALALGLVIQIYLNSGPPYHRHQEVKITKGFYKGCRFFILHCENRELFGYVYLGDLLCDNEVPVLHIFDDSELK